MQISIGVIAPPCGREDADNTLLLPFKFTFFLVISLATFSVELRLFVKDCLRRSELTKLNEKEGGWWVRSNKLLY